MQTVMEPAMEEEISGCHVTLFFVEKPVEGVMERIQSILSNAYEERVQNDLKEIVSRKAGIG